jgi:GDPmannose 4,6-dehydratase
MLQQDAPDDFVLATGESHTVREFCQLAFERVGLPLEFQRKGVDEVGIHADSGRVLIEVDPRYFRPTEVDSLLGDAEKARRILGWMPRVSFGELVNMMADGDLQAVRRGEPFTFEPSLEVVREAIS